MTDTEQWVSISSVSFYFGRLDGTALKSCRVEVPSVRQRRMKNPSVPPKLWQKDRD